MPVEVRKASVDGLVQHGRAQPDDKTKVDTWLPALAAYRSSYDDEHEMLTALRRTVTAAKQGKKDTIPLQAKKGRVSDLGERSKGHQDPGATSSCLVLQALLDSLEA